MSSKMGNNNVVAGGICIGLAMKTAVACAVAYLLRIMTSPLIVPADYFASPGIVVVLVDLAVVSNDTTVPP